MVTCCNRCDVVVESAIIDAGTNHRRCNNRRPVTYNCHRAVLQPATSVLEPARDGTANGGRRAATVIGRCYNRRSTSCNRQRAMIQQQAAACMGPCYNRQPASCNRDGAVLQPEAGGAATASCRQCWNKRRKIYNQRHKRLEPARAFIVTVENGLCCRRDFPGSMTQKVAMGWIGSCNRQTTATRVTKDTTLQPGGTIFFLDPAMGCTVMRQQGMLETNEGDGDRGVRAATGGASGVLA